MRGESAGDPRRFIEAKKAAPKMTIYAALEENSSVREENSSGRKSVRKIKRFALHIRASTRPAAAGSGTC